MNTFMTEQDLKNFPILFQENNTRSDKYSQITTIDKIREIQNLGWMPTSVKQQNSAKYKGYQSHMVLFQNPDFSSKFSKDGVAPQILLQNSYNGLKSFALHFGLYRFCCSNGLIVGEDLLQTIKTKHKGLSQDSISETIEEYIGGIPMILGSIDTMKSTKISSIDKLNFAGEVLEIKYPYSEGNFPIHAESLLEVRRPEDKADSVWETFNVIQENALKGGQEITGEVDKKRQTKTRAIKDISRDIMLNKAIWNTATKYCR